MKTNKTNGSHPESWGGTLAGVGLFLLAGMGLILSEVPREWTVLDSFGRLGGLAFLVSWILPVVGYAVGWALDFPRWSYAYLGMALITSAYLVNVSTPGFRIFGYSLWGRDLWGWRAWVPFLVATSLALLASRSLRPLKRLLTNSWHDWTRPVFGMFGCMPLLITIAFDEIDRLYSLYFMLLLVSLLCVTAYVYLRARRFRTSTATLVVGILIILAVTNTATTLYWVENGWVDVMGSILLTVIVAVVIFSPYLLALLRTWLKRITSHSAT